MDEVKFRSWVFARQGLESKIFGTAREALAGAGWQRSVGGVNPYLAILARSGESREAVDQLAAALELFELPSARACTYVLPADHFVLGLAAARGQSAVTEIASAHKLGATDSEIETLKAAVVEALKDGPLSPADMKPLLGDKVRNFGEEGKKKGLTTSLPLALALLQTEGYIRRKPANGRFDIQRYAYELWQPPLTNLPTDEEAALLLAQLYIRWNGAATLKEFREFTLLSAKTAKAACDSAGLVPFGDSPELLSTPELITHYQNYQMPVKPVYKLVSSIDSYLLNRRGSKIWLAEEDGHHHAPTERGLKPIGDLMELSSHAILDRGRLVGLWEFNPADGEVVWTTWIKQDDALLAAVAEMETYVREQLGDARSFSLDSPASRKPKLEAIKAMKSIN